MWNFDDSKDKKSERQAELNVDGESTPKSQISLET
jgi:hypothetical protein